MSSRISKLTVLIFLEIHQKVLYFFFIEVYLSNNYCNNPIYFHFKDDRCKDGSLDMRFKNNWNCIKYTDEKNDDLITSVFDNLKNNYTNCNKKTKGIVFYLNYY